MQALKKSVNSAVTMPVRSAKSEVELQSYFPKFLFEISYRGSSFKIVLIRMMQILIRAMIWVFLRPRKGPIGTLDSNEVNDVYSREAPTYDWKHHMTTHGHDTLWRREAGWKVLSYARERTGTVHVLDLCTGTGLCVEEMISVMSEMPDLRVQIVGVDYNIDMLDLARRRRSSDHDEQVTFLHGDATKLTDPTARFQGLYSFSEKSFEMVTQVFGIGGINEPRKVFGEVLKLLVSAGRYCLIDMHQPILNQPGTFFCWFRAPLFEAITYRETTIPLALKRLWGWRDTTQDFYILPLITYIDANGVCWGFRVLDFDVKSEQWWLGLPLMTIGNIIVEKVQIQEEEMLKRQHLLNVFEEYFISL